MENKFVELYSAPLGLRKAIDQEDINGQIDRDTTDEPFITSIQEIDPVKKIYKIGIVRNRFLENILVDSKKRKNAIIRRSYDLNDGWVRPETEKEQITLPSDTTVEKPKERRLRENKEQAIDFEHIIRKAIQ